MNSEQRERLDRAVRHLGRAAELAPKAAEPALLLGKALLLRGDPRAAIAPLGRSLELDLQPGTAFLLGLAHLEAGDAGSAEGCADLAIAEGGDAFAKAYALRAAARERLGRHDDAAADLGVAWSHGQTHDVFGLLAVAWMIRGAHPTPGPLRRAMMIEVRERYGALRLTSFRDELRYLRAHVALEVGQPKDAIAELDGLAFPTAVEVAFRRGLARLAAQEYDEAALCFLEARSDLELRPQAEVWLERAQRKAAPNPLQEALPALRFDLLPRLGAGTLLLPARAVRGVAPTEAMPMPRRDRKDRREGAAEAAS